MNIKVSINQDPRVFIRQSPKLSGKWQGHNFIFDQTIKKCDWWVAYDSLKVPETCVCDPAKTILITPEPPDIKHYHPNYLKQFAAVVTAQDLIHPNIIKYQQSLPWLISVYYLDKKGIPYSYDQYKAQKTVKKTKLLSIISSNKQYTEGHRLRYNFVQKLKDYFGEDELDVFGNGINPIDDKWDGIAKYKYHITIENSTIDDYFTEKIGDAFLALAYPFYYGCTNIDRYFPRGSYTIIDIANPEQACKIIKQTIKNNTFEKSQAAVLKAKTQILDEYNLFPSVLSVIRQLPKMDLQPKTITIYPEHTFYLKHKVYHFNAQVRQKIRAIIS